MNRLVERGQTRPMPAPTRLARLLRFLWEVFWLPFWLGSTLPPPALPDPAHADGVSGERTPRILRQLDDLRGVIWRQRAGIIFFRTLWLAFLILDVWLVLRVVGGRHLTPWPFLLLFLAVFPLGVALISLARPSRAQLARALDRTFGLRERIATALEETGGRRLTGVRALQVVDATRVVSHVGRARAFDRRIPVREIGLTFLTVGAGVILLAVLLFQTVTGDPAAVRRDAAPGQRQAPAAGRSPADALGANGRDGQPGVGQRPGESGQPGSGPGPVSGPSAEGQRDLDAVAGALRDHAATRDAADRLQSGDYRGAADAIRDAGQSAGQLSPDARRGLAGDLRDAAGRVADPQLRRDLADAADALEQPNAAGAPAAFDRVASDIDRIGRGESGAGQTGTSGPSAGDQGRDGARDTTGQSGGGPGAGQGLPGEQRQGPSYGASTPPLGVGGQPIELPQGDGRGPLIPSQGQGGRTTGPSDPGATGAGGGGLRQGAVGEAGPDANRFPLDQRGAVERYFTPQGEGDQQP